MTMGTIYSIYLDEPNPGIENKIKECWPERYYTITPTFFLIAPVNLTTTYELGEQLETIGEDGNLPGIVISEIIALGGRHFPSLWEWKRKFL